MTEALRRPEPLPDDTGDVLASIRRLIARDNATAPAPVMAGTVAQMPCAAGGRDIRLPCAAAGDRTRIALTAQDSAWATGRTAAAAAVSIAATRMSGLACPIPVAGGMQAPLRLNPDAMIPAADAAGFPAGPLRLPQGPASAERAAWALPGDQEASGPTGCGAALPPAVDAVSRDTAIMAASTPGAHAIRNDVDAAAELNAKPCDAGPHDLTTPSNPSTKDTTMQAYPTGVVSTLHAEPAMAGMAERCPANPSPVAQTTVAQTTMPPAPAAAPEENPLRALLREVVREEFEAEMQRRLDDNLRSMIRGEIVVALTEALVRRPA